MRSIQVIAGLGARNGGPAYSVPRLQRALMKEGVDSLLFAVREEDHELTDTHAEVFQQSFASIPIISKLRLSPGLRKGLLENAPRTDVVHNHGLWLMPNVHAGFVAAKAEKPLVVSPRGMLTPGALKYSALQKRVFWTTIQRRSLRHAAVWHATSDEEMGDIRAFGIRSPIAVVPNGVDIPRKRALHAPGTAQRTILFLSRLHPKKGVSNLVSAWLRVQDVWPDWQLVIAGPDEGNHRAEIEAKIAAVGARRINLPGPVYNDEKTTLLEEADIFVLPTETENFGIAVAEALAAGVPAIVTKGAPWAGLEQRRCGWWIDHGVEPLASALHEAMALPVSERRIMGENGRLWMQQDFSWDCIGQKMAAVYRWLADNGDMPDCVQP